MNGRMRRYYFFADYERGPENGNFILGILVLGPAPSNPNVHSDSDVDAAPEAADPSLKSANMIVFIVF